MPRKRLNITNGVEITSVGDYLKEIKTIQEENIGFQLFFRGQKVEYWDIQSSLFRENKLDIEDKLLRIPLTKVPNEFSNKNIFDVMTKCQHYGLCTRLLDITTNPLVALFFACQKSGYEEYEKDIDETEEEIQDESEFEPDKFEPWGIVYYTKNYPTYSYSKEVKIVSFLSQYDFHNNNGDIASILDNLYKNQIISDEDKNKWSKKEYQEDFIKLIQQNYCVIPVYNNERLSRQSGAFLLPSCFSVKKDETSQLKIYKSCSGLRNEFDDKFLYINGEDKENILNELDLCNINESTLFPELEHQLNYIKSSQKCNSSAPDFVKYNKDDEVEQPSKIVLVNNVSYKQIQNKLEEKLKREPYLSEIVEVIKAAVTEVDWFKKDSAISRLRKNLKELLIDKGCKKVIADEKAEKIVTILLDIVEKISDEE